MKNSRQIIFKLLFLFLCTVVFLTSISQPFFFFKRRFYYADLSRLPVSPRASWFWWNFTGLLVCLVFLPVLLATFLKIVSVSESISSAFQSVFFWFAKLSSLLKVPEKYRRIVKYWTEYQSIRFRNYVHTLVVTIHSTSITSTYRQNEQVAI